MLKEIFEQPAVIAETLEGRIHKGQAAGTEFRPRRQRLFDRTGRSRSSPAAPVTTPAWSPVLARRIGIPCQIEVASEFRYRKTVVQPDTLFVTISQSG